MRSGKRCSFCNTRKCSSRGFKGRRRFREPTPPLKTPLGRAVGCLNESQNFRPTCLSKILSNQNSTIAVGDTVSELDKTIWIIFQDKNNNYWFGSNGQGVYRFDGKTILHFSTKDGLLNNGIRGIQEDKL